MSGRVIQGDTSLQHPVVKDPNNRDLKVNRLGGDGFATPQIPVCFNVPKSEVLNPLLPREVGEEGI